MEKRKVERKIPVKFNKLTSFENEDTRFLNVKIWLCHTGANLNGSYFSKEVLEKAIPSLSNTPILAFLEENNDGELDFSDHRQVLVVKDNEVQTKYLGKAIGTIPETNNAQFEMLEVDGVEKEYLTVEGFLWTKFDDSIDIMERDELKSQSMELDENYEGEFGDDGFFHFTDFKFFGACALGTGVLPAMQGSRIELDFSTSEVHKEIQNKMEELKMIQCTSEQGGNTVTLEELLAKYSVTTEELAEAGIVASEFSIEDLEEKVKDYQADTEQEEKKEETPTEFSFTASQLSDELRAILYKEKTVDEWGWDYYKYWFVDYDSDKVIAYNETDEGRLVAFNYSTEGDKVTVDFDNPLNIIKKYEVVEEAVSSTFMPQELVDYKLKTKEKSIEKAYSHEKTVAVNAVSEKLAKVESDFTSLEAEAKELREYKVAKLTEERNSAEAEVVEKFSTELSEDEVKTVVAEMSKDPIDAIEAKLYTLIGMKAAKFSKKTATDFSAKIPVKTETTTSGYGGILKGSQA